MNFDVTVLFPQGLNIVRLLRIIRLEFVTSKFVSHSHYEPGLESCYHVLKVHSVLSVQYDCYIACV